MNSELRNIVLLSLIATFLYYVETMVVPALPDIQRYFSSTASETAWVASSYLVVGASTSPIIGKLGDIHGKKKMLLVSLIVYSLMILLAGFSPSILFLIIIRGLQGIGLGAYTLTLSLITDLLPKERVALAQGILSGAVVGVGMALGLVVGAYIDQYLGWQYAFHTAFIVSIALLIITYLLVPESNIRIRRSVDYLGSGLLMMSTVLLLVYITEIPYIGAFSPSNLVLLLASVVLFSIFLKEELRQKEPMIDLRLMKIRNVMIANLVGLIASAGMFVFFFFVIYYAQTPVPVGLAMDVLSTGLTLAPATIIMLVIGPLMGYLMLKIGAKYTLLFGAFFSALSMLLLLVNKYTPFQLTEDSAIIGIGLVAVELPIVNMVAISMPEEYRAVGMGMNTLMRVLGYAVGPVIATTIMDSYQQPIIMPIRGEMLPLGTYPSSYAFTLMVYVAISLMVFSGVISLLAKNYKFNVKVIG